jgi:putative addiction module killer protein
MVPYVVLFLVIEIREYVTAEGNVPYRDWVARLDTTARVRIITAVLRMEQGNFSSAKTVGSGLSELRLDFGPGYRIYFGRDGERLVILFGGGTKRRQQSDIEAAKRLWSEYKGRKREK